MVADKDFTAQWVQSHVPSLLAEPDRLRELGDKHGSTAFATPPTPWPVACLNWRNAAL